MNGWLVRIRRRFAEMRLEAKLAWLSAGLTALFIVATFVPLTLTSRSAMIQVVTDELHQTQYVLLESQTR